MLTGWMHATGLSGWMHTHRVCQGGCSQYASCLSDGCTQRIVVVRVDARKTLRVCQGGCIHGVCPGGRTAPNRQCLSRLAGRRAFCLSGWMRAASVFVTVDARSVMARVNYGGTKKCFFKVKLEVVNIKHSVNLAHDEINQGAPV